MTATDEQTVMASEIKGEIIPGKKEGKVANLIKRRRGNPWLLGGLLVLLILIAIAGLLYWNDVQSEIYIENSQITAPVISISPSTSGVIDLLYVSVGDHVRRNQVLAKVGDEVLSAKTDGVITGIEDTQGQRVTAMDPVISMIDTQKLRVIGRVQEDKGLKDLYPGQHVMFTVDAFPSSQYQGVVETVAPASRVGDIVFSISDKQQEQEFDAGVSYDVTAYPELKNGMSAKMWISK
ncbi:MAG: efflux RND transporter periplasmic adaptor subunit [Methanoregula sp.]|jgi:multidrug resistance efflux pump